MRLGSGSAPANVAAETLPPSLPCSHPPSHQGFFRSLPIYFSIHVGLSCPPSPSLLRSPSPSPSPSPSCLPPSLTPSLALIHLPSPLPLCLALTHPLPCLFVRPTSLLPLPLPSRFTP